MQREAAIAADALAQENAAKAELDRRRRAAPVAAGPEEEPQEEEPEPEPIEAVPGATEGEPGADTDGDAAAGDGLEEHAGLAGSSSHGGGARTGSGGQGSGGSKAATKPAGEGAGEGEAPLPDGTLDEPAAEGGGDPIVADADEPPPTDDAKVDCLLNPDRPGCKKPESKTEEETAEAESLPEKLGAAALKSGFDQIKTRARQCGEQHAAEPGTKVRVHVSIEGATGKVLSAKVIDDHAGPIAFCITKAVESVTFARFTAKQMGTEYTLRL
jgi:hypothetical protein